MVPRRGDSGTEETRRSLCWRNCYVTKSSSTKEGNEITAVVSIEDYVLCSIQAEGGMPQTATLLSCLVPHVLSGSRDAEEGMVSFPLLLLSEPACLGSLTDMVPTVLEGPSTSEVVSLDAIGTDSI